ncbi:TIR-like protein FxsC [Nonomuraea helvata]|uniref:TIR-like protein FxsC n=1 Tax=Nonomuraea helvata TaxID=37484 RepID=A0ABV5S9L9_9ACTN
MSPSGGIGQVPYFFLSYAHAPDDDSMGGGDPDRWVHRLFLELCTDLLQITGLEKASHAGFMDRRLRLGEQWSHEVSRALATCRVFVPLYSPRYFSSEHCGKEWSAIQLRLAAHPAEPPPVIIPIMWTTIESSSMPECATKIQFHENGMRSHDLQGGLYGIIKVSSRRAAREKVILQLARRIREVAESSPLLEARDFPDYTTLPNAFVGYKSSRTIKVTVVAPDIDHLPEGRTPYYYGKMPHEWSPYRREGNHRPLVSELAEFARIRGIDTEVAPLDMPDGEQPDAPGVVLVDPWATQVPDMRDTLSKFGSSGARWFPVMVPWNDEDAQTSSAEPQLRRSLAQVIPGDCGEPAAHDVRSLDDLRQKMPKMLARASERFLQTAQVNSPPSGRRPRLIEPGDGDAQGRK